MLNKRLIIFVQIILLLLLANSNILAQRGKKFKHADKNKDGTVDKKEWKMEKKWEQTQKRKRNDAQVNTALESKYDEDGDGLLTGSERTEYLKSRYSLIQSNGKAKVDSELEEEYDTDGDGIIDINEAQALKEDLD